MTMQMNVSAELPTNNTGSGIVNIKQEMMDGDGVNPSTHDILMGRGNSHKNHPGNIIFQGK